MDSRAFVALTVGITGFVLGLLSLIEGGQLGLFAGLAALGAAVVGFMLSRELA